VSAKDENARPVAELRGLYCTNCHNALAQALYRADDLSDTATAGGRGLRARPMADLAREIAGGDEQAFRRSYADPVVAAEGEPLVSYYDKHSGATLVRAAKDPAGALRLLPWNAPEGDPVPYGAASGGADWWLAPSEPHCADCHLAPFVESAGGAYFPIDQPGKYSLYRYSKAHGSLACQSCHESTHGLYPVRYEGPEGTVDITTHEQALQFSPDGEYAGPVTCAACHRVNDRGVPVQLADTAYAGDYWAAVVLLHAMRGDDPALPAAKLAEKYPYEWARSIVQEGWE
jgi:mono/diheme cytochrome c family protein